MRFRGKSIRRKIVALLLVPLLSLTAIWGFAAVLAGREAMQFLDVADVSAQIKDPVEDTIHVIQTERRRTLVQLAEPGSSEARSQLQRSRTATDEVVARLRESASDSGVRNAMGGDESDRLTVLLNELDGLDGLRRNVEEGGIGRVRALELYNALVDPAYVFLSNLHGLDNNVEMDKQSRAVVHVSHARELLSREDALLGSALIVKRITREELREISGLVAQRTLLYDVNLPLLPASERERYERFWKDPSTKPLRAAEQSVVDGAAGTPRGVSANSWNSAAGETIDALGKLDDQVGDRFQERLRSAGVVAVARVAVGAVLGLAGLVLSLFLSVRIGRTLVRDLRRLRLEAHEASGVRLPSVMRRLAAGEQVDVETEAPRLEYDKNEIGEVGQALNTLQRAAVEAAVKQAELRNGVSEVFVNLARRSQVLLHKQLTLLDAMERRTEDTDELADLFRLDHLTTRMRRHAEGLVILSGAAPSRQWRKPVQLMDVVRASVAEVEDYERIEVRRLPRIAVTGPAVADLTHLVAELLENATVFSPPHTAVQVLGERVANGFTLEIHDRGLGMAPEALLDANLRLAETPEFELSDTDRLGLFVVSRLAQRQNVRVSLQQSPYGGTTAIVFIPDALLTDDVPDTNGNGFRFDRMRPGADPETDAQRARALSDGPIELPGLPPSLLDGPVELEAPVGLLGEFPDALGDSDSERGGLFRRHRSIAEVPDVPPVPVEQHQQARDTREGDAAARPGEADHPGTPLPRRGAPKLVSSHGRPVTRTRAWHEGTHDERAEPVADERPEPIADERRSTGPAAGTDSPRELPRRRRQQSGIAEAGATAKSPSSGAGAASDPSGARPGPSARRDVPARGGGSGGGGGAGSRGPAADGLTPAAPLPRRVRQASLAPQLKDGPDRRAERTAAGPEGGPDVVERDADEVRNRMASLQRGWQRGREENAAGDEAQGGTAHGTTEGDGR
ncbi:nitrate- and nitrite sensing domain-containing protein [Streptomyces cavernae]|uniref:nitrate- and nitrite sensing domain-containing protein n=1 Tax=Streptomyces cavernae TaxID=2259034 RepID=UPI000FEB7567|nr:nitrate- and nitrite sensing domain-containing protein [Streptomyces cavernae]